MSMRDPAIQRIHARKNHCCYGMGLGIIILDDVYPGFPGDVRIDTGFSVVLLLSPNRLQGNYAQL